MHADYLVWIHVLYNSIWFYLFKNLQNIKYRQVENKIY